MKENTDLNKVSERITELRRVTGVSILLDTKMTSSILDELKEIEDSLDEYSKIVQKMINKK